MRSLTTFGMAEYLYYPDSEQYFFLGFSFGKEQQFFFLLAIIHFSRCYKMVLIFIAVLPDYPFEPDIVSFTLAMTRADGVGMTSFRPERARFYKTVVKVRGILMDWPSTAGSGIIDVFDIIGGMSIAG